MHRTALPNTMNRTGTAITVSTPNRPPPRLLMERAASAWLGAIVADRPEMQPHWADLDRLTHALVASVTNGISPASLAQAFGD